VYRCTRNADLIMLRASKLSSRSRSVASAIKQTARGMKVAVLGSSGGIGQPLALLCKLSPLIDEVSCYDVVGTPGVAADLSHCPTPAKVTGNLPSAGTWPPSGNTGLESALTGADVVIIPAGVPRKPCAYCQTPSHHHVSTSSMF
jgi:malate dehydrogenase